MGPNVIFAVQVLWPGLAWAALARLVVWPFSLRLAAPQSVALWVAPQMSRVLGTKLEADGCVQHVWPRDKPRWLDDVRTELAVPRARVAAVGDSASDADLLAAAALRFFVGAGPPPRLAGLVHRPGGDIEEIARAVLARWAEPGGDR